MTGTSARCRFFWNYIQICSTLAVAFEGARKNIFPEHNKHVGDISAGMCATYIMPRLGDKSASNATFSENLEVYSRSGCEVENRSLSHSGLLLGATAMDLGGSFNQNR